MPAFICKDYTDDGCYVWECSNCGDGIEARGNPKWFLCCPGCFTSFTHNHIANTPEAGQKREKRREYARFLDYQANGYTGYLYWLEVWHPNSREFRSHRYPVRQDEPSIESYYFHPCPHDREIHLKTDDDAFFAWGGDYAQLTTNGPGNKMPEPFIFTRWPDNDEGWKPVGMRRKHLIEKIKQFRGCPMRFGILKGEDSEA